MSRRRRLVAVLTTALVGASLAVVAHTPRVARGGTAATPALTASGDGPVVVRGRNFRPHERLGVVLDQIPGGTWAHQIRVRSAGTFVVTFQAAHRGHCTAIAVRAIGAQRVRATLRPPQRPACMLE